jgi:CheY-like chemotaxis protein
MRVIQCLSYALGKIREEVRTRLAPEKILIIEDDHDTRQTFQIALETEGYSVLTATNGLEALAVLAATSLLPGLILCDWNMPKMGGADFLRTKAMKPEIRGIPVIICCAALQPTSALDLGAVGLLAKPFSLAHFLATIKKFYSRAD